MRPFLNSAFTMLLVSAFVSIACNVSAQPPFPQAPAKVSWLPHGYGNTMHVKNTTYSRLKGLHGFRSTPEHVGSYGQPLWGWDVNGYYRGPQVLTPDPGEWQLPIGLIYPDNSSPGANGSIRSISGNVAPNSPMPQIQKIKN